MRVRSGRKMTVLAGVVVLMIVVTYTIITMVAPSVDATDDLPENIVQPPDTTVSDAEQRGLKGNAHRGVKFEDSTSAAEMAGFDLPTASWVPAELTLQGYLVRDDAVDIVWAIDNKDFVSPDISGNAGQPNVDGLTDLRKGPDTIYGALHLVVWPGEGYSALDWNVKIGEVDGFLENRNSGHSANQVVWKVNGLNFTLWGDRSDADLVQFAQSLDTSQVVAPELDK